MENLPAKEPVMQWMDTLALLLGLVSKHTAIRAKKRGAPVDLNLVDSGVLGETAR